MHYWSMDYMHKMLAYFQALAVGAVAFAWIGSEPRPTALLVLVSIALILFAIPNGFLVWQYQRKAVATAAAIEGSWSDVTVETTTAIRSIKVGEILIRREARWLPSCTWD